MLAPRERPTAWDRLPPYAREWWRRVAAEKPRDARDAWATYRDVSGDHGDTWADIPPHAREAFALVAAAVGR